MTPLEKMESDFMEQHIEYMSRRSEKEMDDAIARHEKAKADGTSCPLTSSPHEKALVRVVDRTVTKYVRDDAQEFIQSICLCGEVLTSHEIKSK